MMAAALRPHGGVVMWRAFVYADTNPEDRAKQAYQRIQAARRGRSRTMCWVQAK